MSRKNVHTAKRLTHSKTRLIFPSTFLQKIKSPGGSPHQHHFSVSSGKFWDERVQTEYLYYGIISTAYTIDSL